MQVKWTSHLKGDEKENFKKQIQHNKNVLDRLVEIMQEDVESVLAEITNNTQYELPAWSEYQADRVGKLGMLRKYIELLSIDR